MRDMKVSSYYNEDMSGLISMEKIRVCAYCRVSTDQLEQKTSYTLQTEYYKDWILSHENWTLAGIYADEGITGINTKHRHQFNQMVKDAKDHKFDIIVTKSISRFARNTLDCIRCVRDLKNLEKPVGIYFEKENIYTLDAKSELILTILSSLAQDESRTISENISWAFQKRFESGAPHIPTNGFLGYDKDEDGNLLINEEQAQTIRIIYKQYLEGYGVDSLTHKRVVNKGQKPMYFIEGHH